MEDDALPGAEKWPRVTISPRSHHIVRHAYEQVVTSAARLAAFAHTKPLTRSTGPINERQPLLAIDDLIDFSIHARRLLENTTGTSRFRRVSIVVPASDRAKNLVPVIRIINLVIHHTRIEIARTFIDMKRWMGVKLAIEDYFENHYERSIDPLVLVKSAKEPFLVFPLGPLIDVFQQKILSPVIDICDENQLFLDDDD